MNTRTIRIPQELYDSIKVYIDKEEYSTMADFVLHAMRHTVSTYVDKKKELSEFDKTLPGVEKRYSEVFKQITYVFLNAYNAYSGEKVQVNIRVPDGLNDKIDKLSKPENGFGKRADFLKVCVVCLLSHLTEMDRILDETTTYDDEMKEITEKLLSDISEGIMKRKNADTIIREVTDKYITKKTE